MRLVTSRYEPRRRAPSARDARANAARAGTHRLARQRGRTGLFAIAVTITVLVGAAGIGILPPIHGAAPDSASSSSDVTYSSFEQADLALIEAPEQEPTKDAARVLAAKVEASGAAPPRESGTGKRVVFSQSEQRVWLVDAAGKVDSTYKVSGSSEDNLGAGTYAVQSHTRYATSYDYAGRMQYFVRFTAGKNAPIGFHDIPVSNAGSLLQTTAQLGTPLSSGCIRQARPDAIRLWDFAPVGTKVVVVA